MLKATILTHSRLSNQFLFAPFEFEKFFTQLNCWRKGILYLSYNSLTHGPPDLLLSDLPTNIATCYHLKNCKSRKQDFRQSYIEVPMIILIPFLVVAQLGIWR